ncbi:MAG: ribbon-helix-helix domain-containing protein [Streptosporangiaceae bacterium]
MHRTTLSIDDDVLSAVKERARRQRRGIGEVLSDLARQASTGQCGAVAEATPHRFYVPHPCYCQVGDRGHGDVVAVR